MSTTREFVDGHTEIAIGIEDDLAAYVAELWPAATLAEVVNHALATVIDLTNAHDRVNGYPQSAVIDPDNPTGGISRVVRWATGCR